MLIYTVHIQPAFTLFFKKWLKNDLSSIALKSHVFFFFPDLGIIQNIPKTKQKSEHQTHYLIFTHSVLFSTSHLSC